MKKIIRSKFDLFSEWVADNLGQPIAFAIALCAILLWAAFGPVTNFSQTWQLIVNTGTTIATFLMVFLLQNTQNRDTAALFDRLDEVRMNQELILDLERRLSERLMMIELVLDKKDNGAITDV